MWFPSTSDPRESWHPLVQDTNRNLPKEFLQRAVASNVTVIFYHYMKCSKYYAQLHPDWVQAHPDGAPIGWERCPEGGLSTCSDQWQDTFIAQVVQLSKLGAFVGGLGGFFLMSSRVIQAVIEPFVPSKIL